MRSAVIPFPRHCARRARDSPKREVERASMTERNRRFDSHAPQLGRSRSIWDIGSSLCTHRCCRSRVGTGTYSSSPVELRVTSLRPTDCTPWYFAPSRQAAGSGFASRRCAGLSPPTGVSELGGEDSNPQKQVQNLSCCRLHHPRMSGLQLTRSVESPGRLSPRSGTDQVFRPAPPAGGVAGTRPPDRWPRPGSPWRSRERSTTP